ncbi:MAG: nickel-dependent lactate racemase family protein [Candidatus Hodarchaeales archaeon]|jgi:nickel-dependent lactate racemase
MYDFIDESDHYIKIPFSTKLIQLRIPKNINLEIIKPKGYDNSPDWQERMKKILNSKKWINFISQLEKKGLLIVINDATRLTPSVRLLDYLLPIFKKFKINLKLIIATGSHNAPKKDELIILLGKHLSLFNQNIIIHDARKQQELTKIGETSFGTPIWINKILLLKEISGILTINSIEPHYFAGWTGGRKSIIPGIAGIETITGTHKHALDPNSQPCRLKGNPVNEDLVECFDKTLEFIQKTIMSFQFIIDGSNTIHDITFGHPTISFSEGVKIASQIFQVPVKNEYDIVICVPFPPLDQTLYQAHKGFEHGKIVLKDCGDILLFASCNKGVGPDSFLEPLKEIKEINPNKLLIKLKDNYKLGYHKAAKLVDTASKAEMWLYSNLTEKIAQQALFKPIKELQVWVDNIINEKNVKNILILLDAGVTVPMSQS